MKHYQIIFEDDEEQFHRKTDYLEPAYGFLQQLKQLKQRLKSLQHNNCNQLIENGQQLLKKKIRKNNNVQKSVLELNLHLKGLLQQFINESIQQANKGFVFKQLQNCQEIKSTIDKMERILIRMKSILLSQMINFQKQD